MEGERERDEGRWMVILRSLVRHQVEMCYVAPLNGYIVHISPFSIYVGQFSKMKRYTG